MILRSAFRLPCEVLGPGCVDTASRRRMSSSLDARTRPPSSASEPVAPENEEEGLADVCPTLPTAATERRGGGEVNLFALFIFLRQEPTSVSFFFKVAQFCRRIKRGILSQRVRCLVFVTVKRGVGLLMPLLVLYSPLLLLWLAYLVMQQKLRFTLSHLPLVRSSCQTTPPPLLPNYSLGKGRQSGSERRGERTGIRGKTRVLGWVASCDH